jgi:hypothetical protein
LCLTFDQAYKVRVLPSLNQVVPSRARWEELNNNIVRYPKLKAGTGMLSKP